MLKVKITQLVRNPEQPQMNIDPTIAQKVKVERTGQILGLAPMGVESYSELSAPRKLNGVVVLMDDNNKLEEFQLKEIEVIK